MDTGQTEPGCYEIRLEGRLDPRWAAWFDGMTLSSAGDNTLLRGPVVDQSALHGMLARLRDLGIPLISVRRVDDGDREDPADPEAPA